MANKQALTFNRSLEVTYCRVVILFPWSRISTLRPTPAQLSIPDLVNLSLCSNFIFRLRMGMRQRVSFLKSDCTLCTGGWGKRSEGQDSGTYTTADLPVVGIGGQLLGG